MLPPDVDNESGSYVTVGVLARGGMGEVALGMRRTGSFQRLVAIKRLRAEYASDPSFHEMFLQEARVAGLIRHPNVVSVLDVGIDERGPYLVMEYIEGLTASRILKAAAKSRAVPVQVAARILHQVAQGLTAAHDLRSPEGEALHLIHRDISPQNILIGFDGVARLADFGIAKARGSAKTTTGLLKGKVGYMSPEQLRFQPVTQSSDLFALGVVLFELLSSRRLYRGEDSAATARQIISDPPPDLFELRADVPPELVELSFELLAKDPADRPKSAQVVAQRLKLVIDDLVAQEGALHLDEFLASRFDEDSTEIRSAREHLVREFHDRESGSLEAIEIVEDEEAAPETELSASGPERRRWPWLAGVAALALGVAAVFAVALSDDPPPTREEPVAAPRDVAPPEPETEPEPEPETVVAAPEPEPVPEPVVARPATGERRVPRMRPSATSRPTMTTDTPPPRSAMFSALDLIRGAMEATP